MTRSLLLLAAVATAPALALAKRGGGALGFPQNCRSMCTGRARKDHPATKAASSSPSREVRNTLNATVHDKFHRGILKAARNMPETHQNNGMKLPVWGAKPAIFPLPILPAADRGPEHRAEAANGSRRSSGGGEYPISPFTGEISHRCLKPCEKYF